MRHVLPSQRRLVTKVHETHVERGGAMAVKRLDECVTDPLMPVAEHTATQCCEEDSHSPAVCALRGAATRHLRRAPGRSHRSDPGHGRLGCHSWETRGSHWDQQPLGTSSPLGGSWKRAEQLLRGANGRAMELGGMRLSESSCAGSGQGFGGILVAVPTISVAS
jgi:hypothetical protein